MSLVPSWLSTAGTHKSNGGLSVSSIRTDRFAPGLFDENEVLDQHQNFDRTNALFGTLQSGC